MSSLMIGPSNSGIPKTSFHKNNNTFASSSPENAYDIYVFNNAIHQERCSPSPLVNTYLLFQ